MSKPSEKAMQLSVEIALNVEFVNRNKTSAHEGLSKCAAMIDAHTAAERETQHRNTWALAKQRFSILARPDLGHHTEGGDVYNALMAANIRILSEPCPPIEATKDK